jgi:hypothetical protein
VIEALTGTLTEGGKEACGEEPCGGGGEDLLPPMWAIKVYKEVVKEGFPCGVGGANIT